MMLRLLMRSATTPPIGDITSIGIKEKVDTNPYKAAEPVIFNRWSGKTKRRTLLPNREIIWPITTKIKKTDLPVHVMTKNYFMGKKIMEIILCEQILTVPKSRIKKYLRTLDKATLREVEKAIEVSLGIDVIGGD